jgi:Tfp pilus assembly protein FimT
MLITLAVLSILLGIAALNLRPLNNDAQNAADRLAGTFRQVRARAMATTSAYRLVYLSPSSLRADSAKTCAGRGGWKPEPKFSLTLEPGATLTGANLSPGQSVVCFNSRGLASANPTLQLRDTYERRREVEVLLGGAVEIR